VPVYGPISPANKRWFANLPSTPYDPAAAARDLASMGLKDRNGDGMLEDASGQAVRFSLLAQKGNTSIERGAAVIRDELKKIGVVVRRRVARRQLGHNRFCRASTTRCIRITTTDTDPAVNPDFWLSSGSAHAWNIEQKTPATAWGSTQSTTLMKRQMASSDVAERKRLFDEVADHLCRAPADDSVRGRRASYVAASSRLTNCIRRVHTPAAAVECRHDRSGYSSHAVTRSGRRACRRTSIAPSKALAFDRLCVHAHDCFRACRALVPDRRIVFAILSRLQRVVGAMLLTRLAPGDYVTGEGFGPARGWTVIKDARFTVSISRCSSSIAWLVWRSCASTFGRFAQLYDRPVT